METVKTKRWGPAIKVEGVLMVIDPRVKKNGSVLMAVNNGKM